LTPCDTKWNNAAWKRFALAALASGAFPVGLPPRALERNRSDYNRMQIALADASGVALAISPAWPHAPEPKYQFLSVDGGCVDNEPLELARVELSGGPLLKNERSGTQARKGRDHDRPVCRPR